MSDRLLNILGPTFKALPRNHAYTGGNYETLFLDDDSATLEIFNDGDIIDRLNLQTGVFSHECSDEGIDDLYCGDESTPLILTIEGTLETPRASLILCGDQHTSNAVANLNKPNRLFTFVINTSNNESALVNSSIESVTHLIPVCINWSTLLHELKKANPFVELNYLQYNVAYRKTKDILDAKESYDVTLQILGDT
ncbi:conserved hypothetical protein [Vibrio chagasii]|nr:conserved hypothetical protein [Vibrio chagasii]